MGVLNVTPDSFSDGGRWLDPAAAWPTACELVAEGADVVDVGGESTRPGAEPVAEAEELRRVVPVVEALAPHVRVSIDTRQAGGGRGRHRRRRHARERRVGVAARRSPAAAGVGWVAMHMQGEPRTMQQAPATTTWSPRCATSWSARADEAGRAGVDEVWIDPGIGFGKTCCAQPGAAEAPRGAGRHRLPGARSAPAASRSWGS